MNVAFPWVLWGTLAAVAGVVAAHLLSVTQPRTLRLPTTRFLPERAIRAVSRASSPRDVMLLLVRIAILACVGGALAGITWGGARVPVRTLIAVESSALLFGDSIALRDALQRATREYAPVRAILLGDTLVTIADPLRAALTIDSLLGTLRVSAFASERDPAVSTLRDPAVSTPRVPARSTLAATLLRARRAAPRLVAGADSLRLVLIATERADVGTAALDAIRATWPGHIVRLPIGLQVALADSLNSRFRVIVRTTGDDVVAAAFAQWPDLTAQRVLVIRDSITRADSAAAEAGSVLVVWWRRGVPPGRTAVRDTIAARENAVIGSGRAVIAPFARTALAPENAPALLWWPNGTAAATEEPLGRGCIRWVGVATPEGDALLSVDARAVLSTLTQACGAAFNGAASPALDSTRLRRLSGSDAMAAATAFGASLPRALSPFTRWLLLAVLLLLVVEQLLRRRGVRESGAVSGVSKRGADAGADPVADNAAAYPEAAA